MHFFTSHLFGSIVFYASEKQRHFRLIYPKYLTVLCNSKLIAQGERGQSLLSNGTSACVNMGRNQCCTHYFGDRLCSELRQDRMDIQTVQAEFWMSLGYGVDPGPSWFISPDPLNIIMGWFEFHHVECSYNSCRNFTGKVKLYKHNMFVHASFFLASTSADHAIFSQKK